MPKPRNERMMIDDIKRRLSERFSEEFLRRWVQINDSQILIKEKEESGRATIDVAVKGLCVAFRLGSCQLPFRRKRRIGDGIILRLHGDQTILTVIEIKPAVCNVDDVYEIKEQLLGSYLNAIALAATLGVFRFDKVGCLVALYEDKLRSSTSPLTYPESDQASMRKRVVGIAAHPIEEEWKHRAFRFEGRDEAVPIQVIERDDRGDATASL